MLEGAQNEPYTFHPPALLWSKRRWGVVCNPTIAHSVDGKTGRRRPMESSLNTRQTDPHDVNPGPSTQDRELVSRADERLVHAYAQIARADEQLARVNEQLSKLEYDARPKKSANRYRRPSHGRPVLRGFVGMLLTAGIFIAAFAWQSYGETARPMISRWAPQLAAASPLPAGTPKLADQQSPPAVQVAVVDGALSQLPPPAEPAPQDAPPRSLPS